MQGQFELFTRRKRAAIVRRYPVVRPLFLYAVFSCFRNPPNSDMDYMIFTVRTHVIIVQREYTLIHTGGLHTARESVEHVLTRKNSQVFFLCSWPGSNLGRGIHWIFSQGLLPIEPRAPPWSSVRPPSMKALPPISLAHNVQLDKGNGIMAVVCSLIIIITWFVIARYLNQRGVSTLRFT